MNCKFEEYESIKAKIDVLRKQFKRMFWYTPTSIRRLSLDYDRAHAVAVKNHKKRPLVALRCVQCGKDQYLLFDNLGSLYNYLLGKPEVIYFDLFYDVNFR